MNKRETWVLGYAKGAIPALAAFAVALIIALVMAASSKGATEVSKHDFPMGYPTGGAVTNGTSAGTTSGSMFNSAQWHAVQYGYYKSVLWFQTGLNNWMSAYNRELISKRYSY